MHNVEVVAFPSGHTAVYVGSLQVGKVFTREDGRLYVKNETPSFFGFSFRDAKAIELFVRCIINGHQVPNNMGIDYDNFAK